MIRRKHVAVVLSLGLCLGLAVQAHAADTIHPSGIVILDAGEGPVPEPFPEQLALTLHEAMALSEKNPDDFGYPFVNRLAAQVVLTPITAKGAQLAEELVGRLDDASTVDLYQLQPATRHTRRYLEQVMDAVIGIQPDGSVVQAAYPDPETGRIVAEVIGMNDKLLHGLAANWKTSALAVRPIEGELPDTAARNNDTSPFYGGANIGCTTGFSWHSGAVQMMLTAGHCYHVGGSVSTPAQSMGTVTATREENWTDNNNGGTVRLPGQTEFRGDLALIRLGAGRRSNGLIYRGPAGSSATGAVREMWSRSPARGDRYCTGGQVSGEQCGWTVDWSAAGNYTYSRGRVARRVWRGTKRGWCIRGGDSGGPVYTVRSDGGVAAKGIISGAVGFGGSDAFAGALDPACQNVFTDIWDAFRALPGVLTTP